MTQHSNIIPNRKRTQSSKDKTRSSFLPPSIVVLWWQFEQHCPLLPAELEEELSLNRISNMHHYMFFFVGFGSVLTFHLVQ